MSGDPFDFKTAFRQSVADILEAKRRRRKVLMTYSELR
jgi:hypothetical protein